MSNWLTYLKERFPLPVYALLVGGMSFSGIYLVSDAFDGQAFALSFVGLLMFFAVLRLMDELKDYQKDVIAHPRRPLPRGVLTVEQVARAIRVWVMVMFAYGVGLGVAHGWVSGGLYLFLTVYLWLMFKEFYLREWLVNRPLLYAITHQTVLLPMCMFTVAAASSGLAFSQAAIHYGLAVLGAFFAYEVCRKLDPAAHPVLKTYLSMYGARGTSALVVVLSAVAAYAAARLGLGFWLWPLEALLLLSLALLFVDPAKYKLVETAATLSLLFHIWAVTLRLWLVNWGVL